MQDETLTAAGEWKRYWTLVLASFCGFAFFSIMTAGMGIFMQPLRSEFQWSKTLLSSGVTIASIVTALLSPFFGVLIDRYGARRVALPGLVVTIGAISSFGLVNGSPLQWMMLWGIYAVVSISVKTTVWTAAVAGSFNVSQGLALGLTLSGTAAAQAVVPPLANFLIDEYGWRLAYVILGCGWGSVTLLLCLFFLFDAHDRKAKSAAAEAAAELSRRNQPGLTIGEAWRNLALWRIGASCFIMMVVTIGLLVHQIDILTEAGVSRSSAAWLASMAGLAGIAGKLVTGVLLDRFRANWVGGLTVGMTAFAFALLIDGIHSPGLIVVAMLINGYSAGCKLQISSFLTARFAGMRNYGTVYGLITSLIAFGSGVGPVLAGLGYDLSGSYTPFLIAGALACLFCGWLIGSLPSYPDWGAKRQEAIFA